VLAKGVTPAEGNLNNTDIKVTIKCYKHDRDKAMPKNKEGLILRYCEIYTRFVDNNTYSHEDTEATVDVDFAVDVDVVGVAAAMTAATIATITTVEGSTFPFARCLAIARMSAAGLSAATWLNSTQNYPNTFSLADFGDPTASYDSPVTIADIFVSDTTRAGAIVTFTLVADPIMDTDTVAIVARATTKMAYQMPLF
jgi:hypothetical protein